MPRHLVLLAVCAVSTTVAIARSADSPLSTTRELTKAEAEFDELCKEMYAAFDDFYARDGELNDAESKKFRAENDPWAKYVTKLIEFERTHHTTHAGLMAAYQLGSV